MTGSMGKEEAKPALGKLVYKAKADNTDASKRMHDYLASQQRKKEEHWMRKYGKVLDSPKKDLIKAERSANSTLPPINARQGQQGQPPMFAADGPIRSFPHAVSKDKRHNANIPYHPALPNAPLLPQLATLAEGSETNTPRLPSQPSAVSKQASQPSFGQLQHPITQSHLTSHSSATLQTENSKTSGLASTKSASYIPAVGSENSGAFSQVFRAGPMPRHGAHINAASLGGASGSHASLGSQALSQHSKPAQHLQLELNVVKSIKAREDTLDRLKVACEKLGAMFGGVAPQILPSSDPMTRLMFRLVAQLRSRTLDCVETLAAWHKRSGSAEHFMYYGAPYMKNIGPDLAFLDHQPFLRARLQGCHAVDDPFLMQVTSDGIPIEEATAADLRRGAHRFSADALRIRVARKVLQTYCHHTQQPYQARLGETSPLPSGPGVDGLDSFDSSSLSSMADDEGMRCAAVDTSLKTEASNDAGISHGLLQQPLITVAEEETQDSGLLSSSSNGNSASGGDVAAAIDEDGDDGLGCPAEETCQNLEEDGLENEDCNIASNTEHQNSAAFQEQVLSDFGVDSAAAVDMPDVASQTPVTLLGHLQDEEGVRQQDDDGAYIDYALDAIVASLEEPYAAQQLEGQQFTIAGWEIDRQLAEVVHGLEPESCQGIMACEQQLEQPHEVHTDMQAEQPEEQAQPIATHEEMVAAENDEQETNISSVNQDELQQGIHGSPPGRTSTCGTSKALEIHVHVGRNDEGRVLARLTSAPASATNSNLSPALAHRPATAQVRLAMQIKDLCGTQQHLAAIQGQGIQTSTQSCDEQAIEMVIDIENSLLKARPSQNDEGVSEPNQSALVGISFALPSLVSSTGLAPDVNDRRVARSVSLAVRPLQPAASQFQGGSRSFHLGGAGSKVRHDRFQLLLDLRPGGAMAASHTDHQRPHSAEREGQEQGNSDAHVSEVTWVNMQLCMEDNGELTAALTPCLGKPPGEPQPSQQCMGNGDIDREVAVSVHIGMDGENVVVHFPAPAYGDAATTDQAIDAILDDLVASVCL